MNNRQAGLIAAAAFLSGRVGATQTTIYGRAAGFTAYLDQQDEADARSHYARTGERKSVEEIAEENGRGSFERLTARQAPEGKPLDPTPWRDVMDRDWRGSNRLEVAHPVWAPRSSFEQDFDTYPKEQK